MSLISGEYNVNQRRVLPSNAVVILCASQTLSDVWPSWSHGCNLSSTAFIPNDANFPLKMPRRPFMNLTAETDPPLSQFGYFASHVVGRQFALSHFSPKRVFSAPPFKCINTAAIVTGALKHTKAVSVEPGLWSRPEGGDSDTFCAADDARQYGFLMDLEYSPKCGLNIPRDKLASVEQNTVRVFQELLDENPGQLLFVVEQPVFANLVAWGLYGKLPGADKGKAVAQLIEPSACVVFTRQPNNLRTLELASVCPLPLTTSVNTTELDFDAFEAIILE